MYARTHVKIQNILETSWSTKYLQKNSVAAVDVLQSVAPCARQRKEHNLDQQVVAHNLLLVFFFPPSLFPLAGRLHAHYYHHTLLLPDKKAEKKAEKNRPSPFFYCDELNRELKPKR